MNSLLKISARFGRVYDVTQTILCAIVFLSFQGLSQAPIYTNGIVTQSNVNNSANSIDANPFSFSELNANSGALLGIGAYTGELELEFPGLVPANQTCFVRIELDDNILESLMGGSIGNLLSGLSGVLLTGNQEFIVQAKNGATVVLEGHSTVPNDFSGELLKIVVNEFNETFIAITPQQDYRSICITNIIGSLIGINTSKVMRVYDPYYVPNALECGRPVFTSYDANGITLDLLELNAGATNIHNAIDVDQNSYSELSLGVVTIPSWIEQKVYFEGLSNATDVFGIRLRANPSLNLIDVGGTIVIRGQNGAQVEESVNLISLLTPQDIDSLSNGDPTTVYFQPGAPVDRIAIMYTSLLGVALDQFLEIYHVFKIAPTPVYDILGSNDTVCSGTSATLIATSSDPTLEIRWYLNSVGGPPIGITASGAPLITGNIWSDTTFWIAAGKPGCPDESVRIPISVWVIATPDPSDISFNLNPAGYCAADSIIVPANSSVGNQFQWYLDVLGTQPITNGMQDGNLSFGIGVNGELTVTGTDVVNSPYTFWAAVQDSVTLCWTAPGDLSPVTITIIDEPAPTTANASQTFCVVDNATLADVQVNQPNINWYDENGNPLTANTTLTDATNYFATSVGAVCESSDSLMISITIIDEPAPTTSNTQQNFCTTINPTVGDLQVNEPNVNWYDSLGNLLDGTTVLVDGMTYYATQVGVNCESSDQLMITVAVVDQLDAEFTGETQDLCMNDTITYTAPVGMTNYNWNVIGGTIITGASTNEIVVVWDNSLPNSIEVSYELINGCLASMIDSIPIGIISCSDLTISKTVDNDSPFIGDEVIFTIVVTNTGSDVFNTIIVDEYIPSGYTYISSTTSNGTYNSITGEWTIATLSAGEIATLEITVVVNSTGDYLNTATINTTDPIDSDLSNNSSSASAEPSCFAVYNEITPNGDGVNDVFYIDCIENYPNNSITIFNRFGNEVFSMDAYANDWDGVANAKGTIGKGEVLPSGTYYYLLRVESEDFNTTGWIYIIR